MIRVVSGERNIHKYIFYPHLIFRKLYIRQYFYTHIHISTPLIITII